LIWGFSLIMLLFVGTASVAQKQIIDSLVQLSKSHRGTPQLEAFYELTFQYLGNNQYEESLAAITKAQKLASDLGDTLKLIKTSRIKGQILRRLDRTNEAIVAFLNVLPLAKESNTKDPDFLSEYVDILNALAVAHTFQANYDKALEYNFESLVVREREGDNYEISVALNNIGLVYFKLKDYDRALEYYIRALNLINLSGKYTFKDRLLINIGLCFNQVQNQSDNFINAQKYINDGLEFCQPNCEDLTVMEGKFGLGISNFKLKRYDQAIVHFSESFNIAQALNDKRFQLENLLYLAEIKIILNDNQGAIQDLKRSEEIAADTKYNELLIKIFREYSRLYNQIGDYRNAALYQDKYIALKDSTYSEQLIKNLAEIQTKFEERENLQTIEEKNENIRLQNELISRQRIQYFFIILVTALTIVLASVLVWANRRQQKHNLALSEAKKVIEVQNKELTKTNEELDLRVQEKTRDLLSTNETLIQVNEELDNFIYRTSHDIRGPLVTLKGVCNVASLDVKDPVALDYLKRLDLTAEKLNSILTRLLVVNQINHTELEATPIDLKALIDDILVSDRRTAIPPRMKINHHVDQSVSLIADRYLMRIILENLIDNSVKFYNTSDRIEPYVNIDITTASPGLVLVKVEDNGIGIDPAEKNEIFHLFVRASERSETGGIGLYLTRVAAQRLGGEIKLVATSDKGSTFHVFLPADLRPILEKRKQAEEQMKRERAKRDRELQSQREQDAMMNQYLPHNKQKDALAS
jgi:signal transduction histidine kinase